MGHTPLKVSIELCCTLMSRVVDTTVHFYKTRKAETWQNILPYGIFCSSLPTRDGTIIMVDCYPASKREFGSPVLDDMYIL